MASNLERMNEILDFWMNDKTFQRSIEERAEAMNWRFFDGPPFASGSPHYGHLLAGSIKDVVPRYRTMRGYKVKRKRGWDCHGLPVEKAVEKALGIDGKKDIEDKIGIETFVEKCRAYVNQTNADWKRFVDHTGRWADIENPYFTMDLDFMESVIWCFSTIYNQNKVYKGFKVQGYCPSCATPLANNEISDGYEDKQDMAITIKFAHQGPKSNEYEASEDGFVDVVAGVIKDSEGRYAMIHHAKENLWFFPGGKVEKGECRIAALKRELKEEVGIEAEEKQYLGAIKIIHLGKPYRVHWFEVTTKDIPTLQENEKHNSLIWVKEEKSENSLGFALNINGNIIDDEKELVHDFIDFHLFKKVLNPEDKGLIEGKFNFLAWTTTPWTLPSNMFLAVGAEIDYVTVYDPDSQEYYVMAENLLKKYYKSADQYKFIYKQKGKELQNLTYQPLFDYIPNSKIPNEFKSQFFQILNNDFVSTEDGTGIVHIAPSFGVEDFDVVAQILGNQYAQEWIFMPVDEYGCFDEQVADYQGMKVFDANKPIMDELKARKITVKAESITHSYPHCWRCHTPLIYKAMSSRFIKEKEMNAETFSKAESINFVPETVKNRFINGLQQAPDWNIARNRYRGSPLPIWQNVEDPEDRFSLGTLDELYHLTKTGSKNLTKNLFIRHGRTDFNDEKKFDGLGSSVLTAEGHQQAKSLVNKLEKLKEEKADLVFILSPLPRTWQTIKPTLISSFGEAVVDDCEKKYFEIVKSYQEAFNNGTLLEIVQGSDEQNVSQLHEQIFVDWRFTDHLSFVDQGKVQPCDLLNWQDASKPIGSDGETTETMFARVKNAVLYWNQRFATKTLIYTSHNDTIAMARKVFRNFDYGKQRKHFLTKNGEMQIHYRDNARNTEVDLHKPYVDSYRGVRDGKTYKRIPEVMDCWFESGSMPFGQDHYLGEPTCNLMLLRHGQSLFNWKMEQEGFSEGYDYRDIANTLSEKGKADAKLAVEKIEKANPQKNSVFYVSLLPRAAETIDPYFEKNYGWKLSTHPIYQETLARFQKAYESGNFDRRDFTNIEVEKNIFLDARIMERKCDTRVNKDYIQEVNTRGKLWQELEERIADFLEEMKKNAGKQVIVSSHYFVIFHLKRLFDKQNYQFSEYQRIPEIDIKNGELYPFSLSCNKEETTELTYPADFIAEGLDQTRGWFRSLHVVGHAIKGENAFKNVIVNGLILAEDGKKMAKSLQNYPDPRGLIEKRGGDAFRLYTLSSPVVRAEPMKFAEKGVEQCFKDFNIPLENVFKFFETYAKIDNRKSNGVELFVMNSARYNEFKNELDYYGKEELESQLTREKITRINPDLIIYPEEDKAAELTVKKIGEFTSQQTQIYSDKEAKFGIDSINFEHPELTIRKFWGKRILIVSSSGSYYKPNTNSREKEWINKTFEIVWKKAFNLPNFNLRDDNYEMKQLEVIKLPTYTIVNELDKWILAELHQTLQKVDADLQACELDTAIKCGMDFMEKLTNWYLRRSRRRFRGSKMTSDKYSAYATLFEVLSTYLKMMAPFTPFITEELWQKLQTFVASQEGKKAESLHLAYRPFASEKYIDQQLMEEIATVRKAIKLALFIRSKNKIAVKQPLQKLGLKL